MQIQHLVILAAATLALAQGTSVQHDTPSYGFALHVSAAQDVASVAPPPAAATVEVIRTSYVAPAQSATSRSPTTSLAPSSSTSAAPPAVPVATTAACTNACPALFKPVCGSDGKTYSNACALSIAQCKNPSVKIAQASEGECSASPNVPATPSSTVPPVPAATTSVPPATTTPAPTPVATLPPQPSSTSKPACSSACTAIFKPVCGSDGKTYSNACELSIAKCKNPQTALTMVSNGECGSGSSTKDTKPAPGKQVPAPAATTLAPTAAPPTSAPVPSTSATPKPTTATTTAPPDAPKCAQMCTADVKPVCGSDGKTYSNACELSVAKCERPTANITKVADGECAASASTPAPAVTQPPAPTATEPATLSPPAPAATEPAMIKPAPPTEPKCEMACMKNFAPVCGSNSKTYNNACLLRLANCKSGSATKISVKHQGSCAAATTAKPTADSVGSSTPSTSIPSTTTSAPGNKGSSNLRGSGAGANSPYQGQ